MFGNISSLCFVLFFLKKDKRVMNLGRYICLQENGRQEPSLSWNPLHPWWVFLSADLSYRSLKVHNHDCRVWAEMVGKRYKRKGFYAIAVFGIGFGKIQVLKSMYSTILGLIYFSFSFFKIRLKKWRILKSPHLTSILVLSSEQPFAQHPPPINLNGTNTDGQVGSVGAGFATAIEHDMMKDISKLSIC